jgi:ATP-dependent protease ClpP protease subunit
MAKGSTSTTTKNDESSADNRFYLLGEVDEDMQKLVADPILKSIQEQSILRDGKLQLIIQGPGGYWSVCSHILSLIDLAKAHDVVVETIVVGEVCSASSIIAVAGSKGHRYISPVAEHMVHYGSSYAYGASPTEMEREAGFTKRFFQNVEKHYRAHCKIPNLHEIIQHDSLFIPAGKCLKWGLADHYISRLDLTAS